MIRPGVFFFGMMIPLAAVALVVYGFWELSRSRNGDRSTVGGAGEEVSNGSARLILDERFARGELDADEYVQRRALLDGTVPSPPNVTAGVSTYVDVGSGHADSEPESEMHDSDSYD